MKRCIVLVCVLSAVGAATESNRDWSVLGGLAAGAEIQVTVSGGKMWRGFLQRTDADSLTINATTSQEALARQDVKRVQAKRPGHRGRNTLIGFAAGTAGGLAAGAAVDHSDRGSWFPNIGKAVFTPIGAVIGTVVGVALPTGGWREVYRAP